MRQVNLLPEIVKKSEEIRRIKKSLIAFMGATFLVILLSHLFLIFGISSLERAIGHLGGRPGANQLGKGASGVERDMHRFIGENKTLVEMLMADFLSPSLLKAIGEAGSKRVWLTSLYIDSKKEACFINGSAYTTQSISEFMLELKNTPFFKSIDLASMEKGSELETKDISFKLICIFK